MQGWRGWAQPEDRGGTEAGTAVLLQAETRNIVLLSCEMSPQTHVPKLLFQLGT